MKHYLLEKNLLEDQILKNRELEKCYTYIVDTVCKISELMDDESIKGIIDIDHRNYTGTLATIYECITPFCIVSLGADETGYYNIKYSIDYRATEMIGEFALTNLVRNIYRYSMVGFTEVMIEQRVSIHSLAYEINFEKIKGFWDTEDNRKYATFNN